MLNQFGIVISKRISNFFVDDSGRLAINMEILLIALVVYILLTIWYSVFNS